MSKNIELPDAFADLAPFVSAWCLADQPARYLKLVSSSMTELRQFYEAVLPRVGAIAEHLSAFPMNNMPAAEKALFELALTFAETAHPADFNWKTTEMPELFPNDRLRYTSAALTW